MTAANPEQSSGPEAFEAIFVVISVDLFQSKHYLMSFTQRLTPLSIGSCRYITETDWHTIMEAADIREWSNRYDEQYAPELQSIEKTLRKALDQQERLTQDQLEDVIRWKLNGQPGRRDRYIERMRTVPDEYVRRTTEAALLSDDPKIQLETLSSIPGIGSATATVVLMFYDPTNYAVGDRYIMDTLFEKDRGMRANDYPDILDELRDRNPGDFNLRTVEKAYYQQYRAENGIGNW